MLGNYRLGSNLFLSIRDEFQKCGENDKNGFQERINRHLADKTPEEARMLAGILLESVNEEIEKTDEFIREIRLRKILEKV